VLATQKNLTQKEVIRLLFHIVGSLIEMHPAVTFFLCNRHFYIIFYNPSEMLTVEIFLF